MEPSAIQQRISLTEGGFHPPIERILLKKDLLSQVLFLSSGYEKDGFAGLTDGFEPSNVLVIYLASLDVIYFSKKNVIFFADAKSDIIFVP